jgi:acetyl esterase/lipase
MVVFLTLFIVTLGIAIIVSTILTLFFTFKTTPYGPILFFAGIVRRRILHNSRNTRWFDLAFRRQDNSFSISQISRYPKAIFTQDIDNFDGKGSRLRGFAGSSNTGVIIYFIHGGGFVMGDSVDYSDFIQGLCVHGDVYSLDYPLAPEHPFPAAVESALSGYLELRKRFPQQKIIVCGDSAGGNLAAGLPLNCLAQGINVPDGVVLIYPFLNLADFNTPSYQKFSDDYALSRAEIEWFRSMYSPDPKSWKNPLVSPLYAESFSGFPPTLIFSAGYDVLLDDSTLMKHLLERSGVNVEYYCYAHLFHGFIMLGKYIKEGDDISSMTGNWIKTKIHPDK